MHRLVPLFALFIAPPVAAQVPEVVENGTRIVPLRIAEIDADNRIVGDWEDYEHIDIQFVDWFDCLGIDLDANLVGGLSCGLPTEASRWFLGSDFCNPYVINDLDTAFSSRNCFGQVAYAWYWTAGGSGTQEHCYVLFRLHEKFSPDCDGPPSELPLDGFVADFGPLDGDPGAYYYAVVGAWTVPVGLGGLGRDAYELIFAQDYDPASGQVTLATCAQPMLWGPTGDPYDGEHGPLQWNDVAPTDGEHVAPDECFNLAFGLCPDPLGAALALDSGSEGCDPNGPCVSLEVPTLLAGSPATFSGMTSLPNVLVRVHYALDESEVGTFVRFGDVCAESQLVPPEGLGVVWTGVTESRDFEFTVDVPVHARGRTVYFQAFAAYRCPEACDSSVVARTVL